MRGGDGGLYDPTVDAKILIDDTRAASPFTHSRFSPRHLPAH